MIQTLIPFSHDLCPIYYLYVVMTDLSESELDSSTFEGFRQSNQYSWPHFITHFSVWLLNLIQ